MTYTSTKQKIVIILFGFSGLIYFLFYYYFIPKAKDVDIKPVKSKKSVKKKFSDSGFWIH